jgi:hypothetical protein
MKSGLAASARAGELVRIAVDEALAQPHGVHQLADAVAFLLARCEPECFYRLCDDLPDRHARVERRIGVLEDHLHVAAHASKLGAREPRDIDAAEDHLPARRLDEPQRCAAERRLSAA